MSQNLRFNYTYQFSDPTKQRKLVPPKVVKFKGQLISIIKKNK